MKKIYVILFLINFLNCNLLSINLRIYNTTKKPFKISLISKYNRETRDFVSEIIKLDKIEEENPNIPKAESKLITINPRTNYFLMDFNPLEEKIYYQNKKWGIKKLSDNKSIELQGPLPPELINKILKIQSDKFKFAVITISTGLIRDITFNVRGSSV